MPLNAVEQADLLSRAGLGDRDAFRRFYEATAGQVFALGIRLLGDRTRAEDLLQDVYLRAWYRAADYSPRRGEPLAWLATMARNRAIDMGRSAFEKSVALDDVAEPSAEASPGDGAGNGKLTRCIGELDEGQRQSVFCAFFEGLSHGEIARRFREPVGTVKTRIRRGLAALKRCLES